MMLMELNRNARNWASLVNGGGPNQSNRRMVFTNPITKNIIISTELILRQQQQQQQHQQYYHQQHQPQPHQITPSSPFQPSAARNVAFIGGQHFHPSSFTPFPPSHQNRLQQQQQQNGGGGQNVTKPSSTALDQQHQQHHPKSLEKSMIDFGGEKDRSSKTGGAAVGQHAPAKMNSDLASLLTRLGVIQLPMPVSYGNLGRGPTADTGHISKDKNNQDLYWHHNVTAGGGRRSQLYSKKVFVGGLPVDISENDVLRVFGGFGQLFIDWPYQQQQQQNAHIGGVSAALISGHQNTTSTATANKTTGYVFLIYESEEAVANLIRHCTNNNTARGGPGGGRLYLTLDSAMVKSKPVQVRPWRIADADFLNLGQENHLEPKYTVHVGSVPRPMKSVELAHSMNELFGNVAYAGIDTDAQFQYPKGSGRVVFNDRQSYWSAVSCGFARLKIGEIDKHVEIKPYLIDGQPCSVCNANCFRPFRHVNLSAGASYFCAQMPCLDYFCERCWMHRHASSSIAPGAPGSHLPFVRDNINARTNQRNHRNL